MEPLLHECGVAMIRLRKPLNYYQEKYGTIVRRLMGDVVELSSTLIRDRVQACETISDLVPPAVARYIRDNRLYIG